MARETNYSETLNLRIDEAMSAEIKRIAAIKGDPDSETARMLIEWGIRAHRSREAALLKLPYDSDPPTTRHGDPMELVVEARWVPIYFDEDELS